MQPVSGGLRSWALSAEARIIRSFAKDPESPQMPDQVRRGKTLPPQPTGSHAEFICVGVAGAPARVGGKAEVVEDVQGLLPGVAGRIEITGGMVGAAEIAQSGVEAIAVPEFPRLRARD